MREREREKQGWNVIFLYSHTPCPLLQPSLYIPGAFIRREQRYSTQYFKSSTHASFEGSDAVCHQHLQLLLLVLAAFYHLLAGCLGVVRGFGDLPIERERRHVRTRFQREMERERDVRRKTKRKFSIFQKGVYAAGKPRQE